MLHGILIFLFLAWRVHPFVITPTLDTGSTIIEKACADATCFGPNTSVNCCAAGCQKCFGGGFEPFPPFASCRGSQCDQGCPGSICPCASCTCCYTSHSITTTTASLSFFVFTTTILTLSETITTTVLSPVFETSTITFTQISEVLFSQVITETTTDTSTFTSSTTSTSSIIITSTVYLTTVPTVIPIPVATTTFTEDVPHLAYSPTTIFTAITSQPTSILLTSTPLSRTDVTVFRTVFSSTPSPSVVVTTTLFTNSTTTTTLTSTTSITRRILTIQTYIDVIISYSTSFIDIALISPLGTTTIFPGAPVTASTTTLPTLITSTVTITGTTTTTTLP
jgi:hypothetical protein